MSMPADQYELYAEFGIAAEKAQVLELEAGNVALLYIALIFKSEEIGHEQRKCFEASLTIATGAHSVGYYGGSNPSENLTHQFSPSWTRHWSAGTILCTGSSAPITLPFWERLGEKL
jgi:hypothetical protein